MEWTQAYDPLGSAWLSTLVAALPVVLLLGSLGILGWSAQRAAALGLMAALAVAILVYHMPARMAFAAAGFGACFGLFPIGFGVTTSCWMRFEVRRRGQYVRCNG